MLQGKHIFIVEDNAGNVMVSSVYLQQSGARVTSNRGDGDVVEAIQQHMPVDLILLDLMLPNNTSGFELYDKIRRAVNLISIPIIAVSAADPGIVMPIARRKGFMGFISKPFNSKLVLYVAEAINGKQNWIE